MTSITLLAAASLFGTFMLPSASPTAAPTVAPSTAGTRQARTTSTRATTAPPRADAEAFSYRVTLEQQEKNYSGKITKKPTSVIETTSAGLNSRAEIRSGGKDLKTGDVLLTNDGGETIYWIRGRSYLVMDAAYREKLTQEITSKMKMTISNGRVEDETRGGESESIAGLPAAHGRITRAFDLGVRVLLMSVKVAYEDHLDVWTTKELAGATAIEATFYQTFINMVPFGDPGLRADTQSAQANLPKGFPLKWSHASVTRKDDGSTEEGSTTFVVSDLKRGGAGAAADFDLPEGLRRVEKW